MNVTVTPYCYHEPTSENPHGWTDSGEPREGQHAVISRDGVLLDGEWVIQRDRRAKVNREPNHPWVVRSSAALTPWTGFRVTVTP